MPITFGTTIISAPETPLVAGSPNDDISDKQCRAVVGDRTRPLAVGGTPPLAKVAATPATSSASTAMARHWKYSSRVANRFVPPGKARRSRIAYPSA